MKKFYLWFIRIVAMLIFAFFLALSGFFLPVYIYNLVISDYELKLYLLFVFIAMGLASIPIFFILYDSIKFMSIIERHDVFTMKSINILQRIRISAFITSLIISIGAVFLYFVVQYEDAPGVLLIGIGWLSVNFLIGVVVSLIRQFILEELHFEED